MKSAVIFLKKPKQFLIIERSNWNLLKIMLQSKQRKAIKWVLIRAINESELEKKWKNRPFLVETMVMPTKLNVSVERVAVVGVPLEKSETVWTT